DLGTHRDAGPGARADAASTALAVLRYDEGLGSFGHPGHGVTSCRGWHPGTRMFPVPTLSWLEGASTASWARRNSTRTDRNHAAPVTSESGSRASCEVLLGSPQPD